VLQFVELSKQDRKAAQRLGKLGKGDQVEGLRRYPFGGRHERVANLPTCQPSMIRLQGLAC
jgi:hypothetical protein